VAQLEQDLFNILSGSIVLGIGCFLLANDRPS